MDGVILRAVRDQIAGLAAKVMTVAVGTVVDGADPTGIVLVLDTAPAVQMACPSLGGPYPVGARVVVLQYPTRGALILGSLTYGFAPRFATVLDVGNTGSAWTIPANTGIVRATVNVNTTVTLPPDIIGSNVKVLLVQGGAGSNTVTWPAAILWDGGGAGPNPNATVGRILDVRLTFDGTSWIGIIDALNLS